MKKSYIFRLSQRFERLKGGWAEFSPAQRNGVQTDRDERPNIFPVLCCQAHSGEGAVLILRERNPSIFVAMLDLCEVENAVRSQWRKNSVAFVKITLNNVPPKAITTETFFSSRASRSQHVEDSITIRVRSGRLALANAQLPTSIVLDHSQPLRLLSGQRENGAKQAREHKTGAIVTYLAAQGWRKAAQGRASPFTVYLNFGWLARLRTRALHIIIKLVLKNNLCELDVANYIQ